MARQYKTGLIITGDASGGIKAIKATDKELAQLNKDFDRGSQRSKKFASNAGGVSRELSVLRRAAAPVGAALAGMFAVNTLQQQIDFADQLQKTNLRIGASTEALSQYNYVASLSGVQFKELTTAWQRQSRRVAQAAQDTGEAQEALATLNLDARALAQLAPEDQFERIAGAMNGVASEAQRVALAQKIWDSEGVKLLQIVNQGSDAIARMRAEAQSLGLTISQETAKNMAGFNDEMDRLGFAAKGLSQTLLADVVPSLTDGMQATSEFIAEMGGARVVLDEAMDVAGALAVLYGGKLAVSIGQAAAATASHAAASVTAARADATAARAATARAAEALRVAKAEQAAAQRALVNSRATAAATGNTALRSKALTQLAAANQRAIAAETAHTAAVNTQAAAMSRATIVTRGLSGAMALIGGPAGAALLAGAGLWYLHDALDDSEARARELQAATHDLTGEIQGLTEAQLKNKKADFLGTLLEQQQEATRIAREISALSDQVSLEDVMFQGRTGAGRARLEGATGDSGLTKQLEDQLFAIEKTSTELGVLDDQLDLVGQTSSRTSTEIVSTAEASKEAARAAEDFAKSLTSLEDRIFPVEKAQRDFAQSQALLQTALMKGEISIGRYLAAFDRLEQSALSDQSWQDAYGMDGKGAKELDKMSEAARDLGMTFESAFEDAIIGGKGFREVLGGIAEDIARIALRKAVTERAADWLSTAASAGMAAFSGGAGGGGAFSSSYGSSGAGSFTGFDQGGYTGPGGKNDPAGIVHAGEFVVKKSVVEKSGVRPMLERLNNMPGYAAGGYVGAASKGAAPAGGGEVKVIYSPTIQVEAQPGATEQDGQRLAKGLDQTIRGRFYELIAKESRPGGVLYKQR